MSEQPSTQPLSWAPDACTLPTVEQPLRQAEFDDVFATSLISVRRPAAHMVELDLRPGPDTAARVAALASRESACCSFFVFGLAIADDRLRLSITAPAAYASVLDALATRAEGAAQRPG